MTAEGPFLPPNDNDPSTGNKPMNTDLQGFKLSPRRIRTAYMRERMLSQLGSMLDQGATPDQIMSALQIGRTTFYKWYDLLAEQERKILEDRYEKSVFVNLRNSYNGMSNSINVLSAIENDKSQSVVDRIEAGKLKNQLLLARVKLIREGPRAVLKSLSPYLQQMVRENAQMETTQQSLPALQNFDEVKSGYNSENASVRE